MPQPKTQLAMNMLVMDILEMRIISMYVDAATLALSLGEWC
jgi:hypothetical protein